MRRNKSAKSNSSFTLVELLVVIGILAILTAAVVIVLNPAELLKQSRDSKRTTDLASINNAIKLLLTQNPDVNLGSASTVYISLADSSSTCGSYSLPSLPSGWKYQCATAANYQKTEGSGWIPVNFSSTGNAASLPSLPADPQNSGLYYYSYVAGGSWEMASMFESKKYVAKAQSDAGSDPERLEVGSNFSLWKGAYGMAAYWPFDEGAGTQSIDKAGGVNAATLTNGSAWQPESSCKAGSCLYFDGVDDYVGFGNPSELNFGTGSFSYSLWFFPAASVGPFDMPWNKGGSSIGSIGYDLEFGNGGWATYITDGTVSRGTVCASNEILNRWAYVTVVIDRQAGTLDCYIDAAKGGSSSLGSFGSVSSSNSGIVSHQAYRIKGYVDDIRFYNRALSAAEVQAIYNATK
jgi:type II secretory pathway pseudopilin PulG